MEEIKNGKEEFIGKCDICGEIYYTTNDSLRSYPEKCNKCRKLRRKII